MEKLTVVETAEKILAESDNNSESIAFFITEKYIRLLLKQIQTEILQEINNQSETPRLAVMEVFSKYSK
jgi:hypothetical protein